MKRIAAIVFALSVVTGATLYLSGGSQPILSEVSPDGRERLELAGPNRWQRLTGPAADLAATARIVDVESGKAGPRSPVFEASGQGETFWEKDRVQIGSSAAYDREARQWTITQ